MSYYSIIATELNALHARLEQHYWERKIAKLDSMPVAKLVKTAKIK